MKKVGTWLKNIRPLKVLTVFLAGIFLFLTQACGAPGVATQPPQPRAQAPNVERYDPTKDYPLSSPSGGINNFSDVDPRARLDEKAANDRAEALIKNAQKNIEQKGIDSREQYVRNIQQGTPLGERVKNLGEDVGSSAEELREGLVKGTQRGFENIKGNTQNATTDLTKNAQRVGEDASKNIQRTAEDAADTVNKAVKNID
ncbi:hypothetical protein H6G93_36245 [Nostoc sp. FACHB-973]|uniref:Uncharacterized protein n=1 Tax=Desmonostoc muscorum LEGE 12446 TaxID=1828758 RepID=A0A8J7A7Z6_DESMC|nr:hypothetical protein [Desmonostoc muscorum]MBD2520300.1 hypothetical protein [Nostoc sp. FACHB-973]MBX9258262.1 hypothetical protein [Desmonostoc muscorum CCALA 125]MCF2146794.1 hypothetical protein [Desmonostoc muscorum LEGE 12446]